MGFIAWVLWSVVVFGMGALFAAEVGLKFSTAADRNDPLSVGHQERLPF